MLITTTAVPPPLIVNKHTQQHTRAMSGQTPRRASITRFLFGGGTAAPMMRSLEEQQDGLSSQGSEQPKPRRSSFFGFGGGGSRAFTDPMAAEHRAETFNAAGGEVFAAKLLMPNAAEAAADDDDDEDDESLPIMLQVGPDGIAMRETGEEGRLLRAVDLENIVKWGKTGNEFIFSFSEDLGDNVKKVRLRTMHAAAIVDSCQRCAETEMSRRASVAEGGADDMLYSSV